MTDENEKEVPNFKTENFNDLLAQMPEENIKPIGLLKDFKDHKVDPIEESKESKEPEKSNIQMQDPHELNQQMHDAYANTNMITPIHGARKLSEKERTKLKAKITVEQKKMAHQRKRKKLAQKSKRKNRKRK